MTDLRIPMTSGTDTILEDAAVQELRASLHGPLLCPGVSSYLIIRGPGSGAGITPISVLATPNCRSEMGRIADVLQICQKRRE